MAQSKIADKTARLNKMPLTGTEEQGVANDLSLILEKLEKGEYKRGFFRKNKFDVVNRTLEIFNEFEYYSEIAKTWAQILSNINLAKYRKVVDLAPGFTPKIEMALYYAGFQGELTVIDNDPESLKRLTDLTSIFKTQFTLKSKVADLFGSDLCHYDLVLGNHIVDDLVISHFAKLNKIKISELYNQENLMKDLWQGIIAKSEKNLDIMTNVVSGVIDRVTASGGTVIISHYRSYMDRMLNLPEVTEFNRKLLSRVSANLSHHHFIQNNLLISQALKNYQGIFTASDCKMLIKKI